MPAKLDQAGFVERSKAKHGDRYDYSAARYANNESVIEIRCPEHGPFMQRARNHMLGRGCPACKAESTSTRCRDSRETFIEKARAIHGDAYDYSKVDYSASGAKVEIICPAHGPFWQRPNSHLNRKAGCPRCAGKFMSTSEFIEKARSVHGDTYGYANTEYRLIKDRVVITCQTHGDFEQTAEAHLIGRGCRFCWYESTTSQGENELADWIASLGLEVRRNDRTALHNGMEIDIFVPSVRAGIEFNGCYWHSDRFDKNKRRHEFKHAVARTSGVRLISVWDFDWEHRRDTVKRHIEHALGISTARRISARACSVSRLTAADTNRLYEGHHLQGAVRSGVLHFGLTHQGEIVAAMSFTRGGTRRGKTGDGEWELARYATSAIVRGGASRLFAAFVRETAPAVVWSFSDNQHFGGGLYEALGFVKDGELPADYRVVRASTLRTWHKSLWQRKSIPARLREVGSSEVYDPATDPRTEHYMQDMVNVLRVWDAGKTRWLWRHDRGI